MVQAMIIMWQATDLDPKEMAASHMRNGNHVQLLLTLSTSCIPGSGALTRKTVYVAAITAPTEVQAHCIPPILEGKDCMACAKTGSGKTLAFALPIIQQLVKRRFGIFALVLTPTRELADQIYSQFRAYGDVYNIQVIISTCLHFFVVSYLHSIILGCASLRRKSLCLITGGQDMVMEGLALSRMPEILIATPGRLADHLDTGANMLVLENLKFLVLDEADQLFSGHFNDQLDIIFERLPEKKQCLLFSATLNKQLEALKNTARTQPFTWAFESSVATVEQLDQQYILTPPLLHDTYLVHVVQRLLEANKHTSIIIFVFSCRWVPEL
ncbi:DDX49 [Cordylochernes scorpioides]|uniref:DDX49 n=1 Tax=Cordylochernes scorpioides TaxID=51811 RepID=A0ABY6KQV1_9ARAC|nr:DDX49 [Cordylochernes scorpioides]